GPWSPKERELLMEALKVYGKDYWKLAEHIGTRSPSQAMKAVSHLKKKKKIDLDDLSNSGDKK
ncbi:hypothetical protein BGZ95_006517, partial [Linnemannia exigua]